MINSSDDVKETSNKYSLKICELEDKCFKLKSELESREEELLVKNLLLDIFIKKVTYFVGF